MNDIKISYTVLACNEAQELDLLLRTLLEYKIRDDEIHVVFDEGNTSERVKDVVATILSLPPIYDNGHNLFAWSNPLNRDFAAQKNFAASKCKGDYIVNIDADELLDRWFIENIHKILAMNPDVDVFCVPRINIVHGITQAHIDKWGWRIDDNGWINFPDFQMRIYKNKPEIKWVRPVHEYLIGHKNQGYLPTNKEFCIMHIKDIRRQERQNKFYSTIQI